MDGRDYPEHLRPYEEFDALLLPVLAGIAPATFDAISVTVTDARLRAVLPRWLASAEWRGLVERVDPSMSAPRTYVLGGRGIAQLQQAA